jgi:hypothetical protein
LHRNKADAETSLETIEGASQAAPHIQRILNFVYWWDVIVATIVSILSSLSFVCFGQE